MDLIKSTQTSQIKGESHLKSTQTSQIKSESHLKDLQESVDFIRAKFDEYEKDKKEKEKCFFRK